jgi:hypothetical protein
MLSAINMQNELVWVSGDLGYSKSIETKPSKREVCVMSVLEKFNPARLNRRAAYLAVAAVLALPCLAAADEVFTVKQTVVIPGVPLNSFDISWVDASLHSYFLSDRSNKSIDVINTDTKAVHQLMPGFAGAVGTPVNNDVSGPNGVLTVNERGQSLIFAGDGPTASCTAALANTVSCSTMKVLDLEGHLLHNIPTGGQERADELCYDPVEHVIQIANDAESDSGGAPFVSFIPTQGPKAFTVVQQIKIPEATNGIEQCAWNPRNGLIYLNIPAVNGPAGADTVDGNVYIIDPHALSIGGNAAIVGKFDIPVSECAGPQGMAIGPAPQILLGCNAASIPSGIQNAAIINENTGKIKKVLIDEGGADEVWFNPGDGHYFIAGGSHTPDVQLGIVDSSGDTEDQTVAIGTGPGRAHSVAADPVENEAYLPIPNNVGGTICGANAAKGCIAIFKAKHDDDRVYVRRDNN